MICICKCKTSYFIYLESSLMIIKLMEWTYGKFILVIPLWQILYRVSQWRPAKLQRRVPGVITDLKLERFGPKMFLRGATCAWSKQVRLFAKSHLNWYYFWTSCWIVILKRSFKRYCPDLALGIEIVCKNWLLELRTEKDKNNCFFRKNCALPQYCTRSNGFSFVF